MKTAVLILVWTLLLLAAGGVALHLWLELDDVSLGVHGWIALGLGVAFSVALGVGLMRLVFLSARRGYDGAAGPPGGDKSGNDRAPGCARDRDDTQR